ncbi:uncharacterized protein VNE69_03304 [Vairimorpha necatrix]|uniref:Uncharacterized protein n=1 Tax=Vairimorpha necatrix TaxID=6039 RepID=A0AAX4JAV0_9MICR
MLKVLSFIVFTTQTNKLILNNAFEYTIKKFESGDFSKCDSTKKYASVFIEYFTNEIKSHIAYYDEKGISRDKSFLLNCKDKALDVMLEEYYTLLKDNLDFESFESIVLVYNERDLEYCINTETQIYLTDFISEIRRINKQREKGTLFFQNICIDEYCVETKIWEMVFNKYVSGGNTVICGYNKNDECDGDDIFMSILFGINIGNVKYFFEINDNELSDIISTKNIFIDKMLELSCGLIGVSKESFPMLMGNNLESFIFRHLKDNKGHYPFYFSLLKNNQFMLSMKKKLIELNRSVMAIENGNLVEEEKVERNKIQKRISDMCNIPNDKNCEEIVLLYFLLKKYNGIELILQRIFEEPSSADNSIFINLLYKLNFIENDDTNMKTYQEEINRFKKPEIIDSILKKLYECSDEDFYIFNIYLFVFAEVFINKYEPTDEVFINKYNTTDELFITLKKISNCIKDKSNRNKINSITTKDTFNLVEIMKEIRINFDENSQAFSYENISMIISSFTEPSSNKIYVYKTESLTKLRELCVFENAKFEGVIVEKLCEKVKATIIKKEEKEDEPNKDELGKGTQETNEN